MWQLAVVNFISVDSLDHIPNIFHHLKNGSGITVDYFELVGRFDCDLLIVFELSSFLLNS